MNFIKKIPIFFFSLLYPLRVYGKENVPEGGAIFASNHFRAIDCGYIVRAYDKNVNFLAKNELFSNKLYSKILRAYGAIPIDRDNPDMKSLLQAIKTIKKGNKLCIFVEGTRNKTKTNELQEIKGGAMVFAVKSKCPIVPIMFLEKGKIFKVARLIIGKPFTLDEFYDKKLDDEQFEKMNAIVKAKMIDEQKRLIEILNIKKKKKNAGN